MNGKVVVFERYPHRENEQKRTRQLLLSYTVVSEDRLYYSLVVLKLGP